MPAMDKVTPAPGPVAAGTPARLAAIVVGGILVLAALWVGWDRVHRTAAIDCGDGKRYTIDARNFAPNYSNYSVKLEGSVADKSKVSLQLDPVQQQKLSEAMQSANETRNFIVGGYNGCAVSKTDYARFGARLEALAGLARQIDGLSGKTALTAAESADLSRLITEYSDLAHRLGSE